MLISCPKCHCIYEVPDDIIKKTGTNLRCHTCGNVWHAMPEDALDYHAEEEDAPYIEEIEVKEPPYRNFPADNKDYVSPTTSKVGKKTRTSAEVKADASKAATSKSAKEAENQEQITLTSDFGTSFTISASPDIMPKDETKKTPWLTTHDEDDIRPNADDRLRPETSFRGYKKTCAFLIFLLLVMLAVFFRRDVVTLYPKAEVWYNKIYLSGMTNAEYLRFEKINIASEVIDNKLQNHIKAEIINTSRYNTIVPAVSISGVQETFQADRTMIKAHEKAYLDIVLPMSEQNDNQGLTLSFVRP